ncbi:MAG: glycosyltransferase family 2 protein [Candidatus Omnitrophica bacterium]|nr:glycosyltransferase family 2 protein [Candidatus Omnitrophota bacterium]
MPKLSVIVPVYNEEATISQVIDRINLVNIDKEIIVVDDSSTDGTGKILRSLQYPNLKVIHHSTNRGKGAAVVTGLTHASGEYAIVQDADLEYDPQDCVKLVDYAVKNNLPIVYGSRFMRGWRVTSFWHYLVNRFLTSFTNILFRASLTDMETCHKLIKLDLARGLNLQAKRFEIEPEITAKILKKGYKIIEVPISYKGRSYNEGKKIGWKDGVGAIWYLIKLRLTKD